MSGAENEAVRGEAMTPEGTAQRFHEAYERLAPQYGYETREASAKPWADVPDNNRALMTAVCAELLLIIERAACERHRDAMVTLSAGHVRAMGEARAATRRQMCREEGHREIETTRLGQVEHQLRCGRCGDEWTRPREILVAESRIDGVARDGGQARFAFAEPQGGCELRTMPRDAIGYNNLAPPTEMVREVPWITNVPDDATHVVVRDGRGNIFAVGNLAEVQCPGCKRVIGRGRCSSVECRMPQFEIQAGKLRRISLDATDGQAKVTYAATIETDQLQHEILDTLLGRDDKP